MDAKDWLIKYDFKADDPLLKGDLIQRPAMFCLYTKQSSNFIEKMLERFNNVIQFDNTVSISQAERFVNSLSWQETDFCKGA